VCRNAGTALCSDVSRHVCAKRGDFFGKALARFRAQALDPFNQSVTRRRVQSRYFFITQFLRQLYRRQLSVPEDFV
jgi:hypothetical protein